MIIQLSKSESPHWRISWVLMNPTNLQEETISFIKSTWTSSCQLQSVRNKCPLWCHYTNEPISCLISVSISQRPQTAGLWCVPVRPVWCPETPGPVPPSPQKPTRHLLTDPPSENTSHQITAAVNRLTTCCHRSNRWATGSPLARGFKGTVHLMLMSQVKFSSPQKDSQQNGAAASS